MYSQETTVDYLSNNEDVQILLSELALQKEFGKTRGQIGLVVSSSSQQTTQFLSFLSAYVEDEGSKRDGTSDQPMLVLDMNVCSFFSFFFLFGFSHFFV